MLLMSYITMVLDQHLLDPVIIKCNQEHFRSSKELPCSSRKGAQAEYSAVLWDIGLLQKCISMIVNLMKVLKPRGQDPCDAVRISAHMV